MFPVDGYSPDFELDGDAQIFFNFVRNYGQTQSTIVGYEAAMSRCVQLLIDREYTFTSGNKKWRLYFENPHFKSPEFYPIYCMENGVTYSMELVFDVVIKLEDKTKQTINVSAGKFPIMLGSKYDIVSSDADYKKHGMDKDAAKSTFISEGEAKTFNMFEMLRVNEALVYSESTDPKDISKLVCTITTESKYGKTAVISMKFDGNDIIRFTSFRNFAVSGKESTNLNVLEMFRVFDYANKIKDQSLEDYILMFTRPEWREKVRMLLSPSLADYYASNNAKLLSAIKTVRADTGKVIDLDDYMKQIDEGLYSHIEKGNIKQKLNLLCMQVVRIIEAKLGLIPLQRRDEYSVKRFKNVGSAMYHLFGIYLEEKIFGKEGIAIKYDPYTMLIDNVKIIFSDKDMTVHYESSFKGNWGLKGKRFNKASVFVEPLKNDEFVVQHYHVNKIVRGRDIHSRSYEIRGIQGTQTGFVDAETPETAKCGLNGTVGLTEWTSIYSNDAPIIEFMLSSSDEKSGKRLVRKKINRRKGFYNTYFVVNGVPIGTCNGKLSHVALLSYRRGAIPFYDIMIYHNESEKYLYVNTDAGRPTRPMLIVNPDTGKLLIDELGLQNETNTVELLKQGVIEFIDAKEQEFSVICRSREYLNKFDEEIKVARAKIAYVESIKSNLKNKHYTRSFEDPEQFVTVEERDAQIEERKNSLSMKFNSYLDNYETTINELEELVESNNRQSITNFLDKMNALTGKITRIRRDMNRYDPEQLKIDKKVETVGKEILNQQLLRYRIQLNKLELYGRYDYCEINPNATLGITSSLLPYLNKNPGPRQVFGCKMAKQAQSYTTLNLKWRQMTTKYLTFPVRARAETLTAKLIGLHRHCIGVPVSIAVVTDDGYGIEDALTVREAFVQAGGFQSVSVKTIKDIFERSATKELKDKSVVTYYVTNDLPEDVVRRKPLAYRNLDPRGVIIPGSIVNVGDCVLGRYIKKQNYDGSIKYIDQSVYVKKSRTGIVESVYYNDDRPDRNIFIAAVSQTRNPEVGDKFSSGHAQKGTSSRFITDDKGIVCITGAMAGMRPDILMNPHAYPSRMTIGMLEEIITTLGAVFEDRRIDASAFSKSNLGETELQLLRHGLNPNGKQTFVDQSTGNVLSADIYTGFVYYYRLVHESRDKIQNRYEGNYKQKTHQPVTGIDNGGGQRYGEMEIEAFLTHGYTYLMAEALTRSSDLFILYTCLRCNTQVFRGDGDIFNCPTCRNIADLGFCETVYVQKNLEHYEAGFGVKCIYVMEPLTELELESDPYRQGTFR